MHGGAGNLRAGDSFFADAARAGLEAALEAGGAVLVAGGDALDAVVAAAVALEDCPVFNAGTGSVLNAEGELEMDAAVMEGTTRRAGAAACLRRVRNPVQVALAVLRDDRHVLLSGPGAEAFALQAGVASASAASLVTEFRREQWLRLVQGAESSPQGGSRPPPSRSGGTVGAVARDRAGHLAAATSTGGILGKRPGRISDSALVGCGTWADDATCAISATGEGELFIRTAFARAVDGALRTGGRNLQEACREALADVASLVHDTGVQSKGTAGSGGRFATGSGRGGCIAIDRDGNLALPFDTQGMPRGLLREGETPRLLLSD